MTHPSLSEVKSFFADMPSPSADTAAHASAAMEYLDRGEARIWDPVAEEVQEWGKRAILAYFANTPNKPIVHGCFEYFDKIEIKNLETLKDVRVAPGAIVRKGSFVSPGCILMPSFVNVGAFVGPGTMIDTWATVGSCAQVGANVHVSGGVGIGGVLEPAHARPVVIEEGVFLGSRCIVVEGVRVRRRAVLGAGVVLTASTPILDVRTSDVREWKQEVPENAIVIPGNRTKNFPGGTFQIPCALIIGERSQSTDLKTSLTQVLRDFSVSV